MSMFHFPLPFRIYAELPCFHDSIFILDSDLELPQALVSFIHLLLLPGDEWEKLKAKSKPPKPKVDNEVLAIARDVITMRLEVYPTKISVRETLSSAATILTYFVGRREISLWPCNPESETRDSCSHRRKKVVTSNAATDTVFRG